MSTIAAVIGRILLAVIFVVSGVTKLFTIPETQAAMAGVGLPAGLAMPTGIFEIVAGLCLALGLATRLASTALFVFVALATLMFHNRFTDPVQSAMALKNLAIMGGLLLVFAHSQMWYGWERMRAQRRGEVEAHDAAERAHEAELRAARAEGAAATARNTVAVPASSARTVVTDVDGDGVPEVRRRRRWLNW